MKRSFTLCLTIALPILLTSCAEEPPTANDDLFAASDSPKTLLTPAYRQTLAGAFADHFNADGETAYSKGANFIAPFQTQDGFCIASFSLGPPPSLEAACFAAELTEQDFYRQNDDGTVSLHVNSNTALAEYYANLFDPTAPVLTGEGAHYSANYTAPVIEIDLGNGVIIRFFDLNSGFDRALSVHGNGKVQDAAGNVYSLSIRIVDTPSGQRHSQFTVK